MPEQLLELRARLLGSFLLFTKFFYKLRTGREFEVYQGECRESHILTVSRALTDVFNGDKKNLVINIPPRYGKTELVIHFVAWAMAHNPSSNFLYISYGHKLAARQTNTIRQIMTMPQYREIFDVKLSNDTTAKDNFLTSKGGSVYADGALGTITGLGAGIKGSRLFGGAILVDDIHKPAEVTSDVMRQEIKDWWKNTLLSRLNEPSHTPIVFIGQRLHEDDVAGNLLQGYDGQDWDNIVLPALDAAGNALCPAIHTKEKLLKMQEFSPYEMAAQYQQCPQPAGGGIFKEEWFQLLDIEPQILSTLITVDSAETSKTHNDATVFSLFGLYKIEQYGIDSDIYGLHWLDCHECWVEPKDLVNEFIQFYRESCRHPVKPSLAAIEKKSTGTVLLSVIKDIQGIQIMEIERTKASGSKIDRFLAIQPCIAQKQVSLPKDGQHTTRCVDHMKKITANNSHRYDDIADTLADAVKLALIDKILYIRQSDQVSIDKVVEQMADHMQRYLPRPSNGAFTRFGR